MHGLLQRRPPPTHNNTATLFGDPRHGQMSAVSVYKISFYCSILQDDSKVTIHFDDTVTVLIFVAGNITVC